MNRTLAIKNLISKGEYSSIYRKWRVPAASPKFVLQRSFCGCCHSTKTNISRSCSKLVNTYRVYTTNTNISQTNNALATKNLSNIKEKIKSREFNIRDPVEKTQLVSFLEALHTNELENGEIAYNLYASLTKSAKEHLKAIDYVVLLNTIRKSHAGRLRSDQIYQYMTIVFKDLMNVRQERVRAGEPIDANDDNLIFVFTEMLSIYAAMGKHDKVYKILEKLKNQENSTSEKHGNSNTTGENIFPKPDIVIYNTLINLYSRRKETINEARRLWQDLKGTMNPLSSSTSLVPDLQTYTAIISAEVRANDWDAVYNLLVEMQDPKIDIKPDIVVRNIILEGIAKNKGIDEAMEEADNIKNKDGIPLDDASYSILLACALFNQRPEFVDKILKDCIAENKMPSVHSLSVSFVTLNTSTSTSTGFSPSQLLSKILELGGKPNEQIFSRLLYKSIKANNYKEAQLIYKLTEENVGKMSISLYGIIIEALCKNKKFEHVKTVFKEMLANDVVPDSYIFYSIMSNCCTDKSQMLYWQSVFRPLNIKYSVHCYNALSKLYIKFYNEGIAFTKVLFTITEMLENLDNEYDITSFNLLFQSINNALLYANRSESNREFVNKVFLNTFSKYKQFTNSITASSPVNIQIASFVDYWYKRKLLPLSEASSSISTATSPDHTTFVHLLDIYTTLNITGYAHSMYVSIPKNILTKILLLKSQSTLNNLMNMFLFHKRYDYVSQVWIDRIKLSYYNIDPVAVAIMLRTCDQQGHILAAKQNFESLLKSHDLPFLISQNSLAFSISTISKNSTPVFCVDAKVIYLYVALLIKYRLLSEIMPAINLWYKTVSSSSLTPDRNRDKQSEGDTAVDSLDDKVYYNNPFTLFDDFSDNEYQDLDFAAAVPNRATLPQHIVSGIISALNDPSLTTESNGENIKIQGEFLRFVEARFPLSVPI